jgi:O-antigen/teichoic acid export membrane protein
LVKADFLGTLLKINVPPVYIRYFVIIVCLDIICTIPFAWLRFQNKPLRFAMIKSVNVLVNFLLSIFLIWIIPEFLLSADNGFLSIPYTKSIELIFLANLVSGIGMFVILLKDIYPAFFLFDYKLFKKLMVYSFPVMLTGLITAVNDISDRYLLIYFLPSHFDPSIALGLYGANIKLAVLMAIYVQMFKLAAEPFLFKQNNYLNPSNTHAVLFKYFSIYGYIIFLFVISFLGIFKYFIGPPSYWVGLPVIPVYILANLFMGFYFNLSFWYKLADRTWLGILITLCGLLISVVINIMFIPIYSFFACAWSHLAGYFTMFIVSFFLCRRYSSVRFELGPVITYFIYTLAAFCFIYFFQIHFYFLNLAKNAFVLTLFLIYLERKEKIFSIFYRNVNQTFE